MAGTFTDAQLTRAYEHVDAAEFPTIDAGEWVRPPLDEAFLFKCCDCGVVHALKFDHDEDGRIVFAAERLEA